MRLEALQDTKWLCFSKSFFLFSNMFTIIENFKRNDIGRAAIRQCHEDALRIESQEILYIAFLR